MTRGSRPTGFSATGGSAHLAKRDQKHGVHERILFLIRPFRNLGSIAFTQRRNKTTNYTNYARITRREILFFNRPFRNLLIRFDEEIPIRKTNCLSTATAGRVFVFPEFRRLIQQISVEPWFFGYFCIKTKVTNKTTFWSFKKHVPQRSIRDQSPKGKLDFFNSLFIKWNL